MIDFRPFRNSDPPALVKIWRSRPPLRGRLNGLDLPALEQLILSKLYFDPAGLIVALEHGQPIGFVHVGFGPSADLSRLEPRQGVVGALAVREQEARPELALELLRRGENYLRAAGAVEITAYGVSPNHPFYLGFYGGCEMPGVLASDLPTREAFAAAGYQECGRRSILQRTLADFRPPVDRALLQARRNYVVEQDRDLLPETWWDALGYVHADRRRFSLRLRNGGEPIAEFTCWDMFPLTREWPSPAMGLHTVRLPQVPEADGAAAFLFCEAWRQLEGEGFGLFEVQREAVPGDAPLERLWGKLTLQPVEEAIVLRKTIAAPGGPLG